MPNPHPHIYTEPEGDPDTLANLGPLRALAGVWEGVRGVDVHPILGGPETDIYTEHYEAHPIDFQTNGPQLLYGLRYHTHIVKTGDIATFHEQVGFWLWEPATGTVTMTLAIPRAQVLLATGQCAADARSFEIGSERGSLTTGIVSGPFLEQNFQTTGFHMQVTVNDDGSWSYDETTTLVIPDRTEPFLHTDRNTLHMLAPPALNPLARA